MTIRVRIPTACFHTYFEVWGALLQYFLSSPNPCSFVVPEITFHENPPNRTLHHHVSITVGFHIVIQWATQDPRYSGVAIAIDKNILSPPWKKRSKFDVRSARRVNANIRSWFVDLSGHDDAAGIGFKAAPLYAGAAVFTEMFGTKRNRECVARGQIDVHHFNFAWKIHWFVWCNSVKNLSNGILVNQCPWYADWHDQCCCIIAYGWGERSRLSTLICWYCSDLGDKICAKVSRHIDCSFHRVDDRFRG